LTGREARKQRCEANCYPPRKRTSETVYDGTTSGKRLGRELEEDWGKRERKKGSTGDSGGEQVRGGKEKEEAKDSKKTHLMPLSSRS
jgi:hypothetical protein